MSLIRSILLSHCRTTNIYLLLGICTGLCISLVLSPLEFSSCVDPPPPSSPPPAVNQLVQSQLDPSTSKLNASLDDYEPKINVANKPQKAQKVPQTLVRPRYYSTELGIRDKLFVGVLTSPEYLHSRGVALNSTIAHLVDKVRYFVSIKEGSKPNVTMPGIVGFTDDKRTMRPFHALKYVTDNYLEDYDYYFLIGDASYVNARRLVELASRISVSEDVHLGVRGGDGNYCSIDGGILLSNSIIKKVKSSLDWCVKIAYSPSDDENLGRCIEHSAQLPCSSVAQGRTYESIRLNATFDFDKDFAGLDSTRRSVRDAVTIFPLYNYRDVYKLTAHFAKLELSKVSLSIDSLRAEMLDTARFTPSKRLTWPLGNEPPNKATSRFDVLRHVYFNRTHVFLDDDFAAVRTMDSQLRDEIDEVVEAAVRMVLKRNAMGGGSAELKSKLEFIELTNGYYKFDATRGVDYLMDLSFKSRDSGEVVNKRIEACKPLGKVEILPVPYVTENSAVNLLVMVDEVRRDEGMRFLERFEKDCLEKRDKVALTMALLYNPGHTSKGSEDIYHAIKQRALTLTEKYKKDHLRVTWLSVRLPVKSHLVALDPLLKLAVADLYVRKLGADVLILFGDSRMELKPEYLNRVRMNTISRWQIFSPIPFVQYHPDVISYDAARGGVVRRAEFDVLREHGRYDQANYDFVSFYADDYVAARKSTSSHLPLVHTDKSISTLLNSSSRTPSSIVNSIFELFASHSNLTAFRAVEPALMLKYKETSCSGVTSSNVSLARCHEQRSLGLGHRGQLTRLILDFKER